MWRGAPGRSDRPNLARRPPRSRPGLRSVCRGAGALVHFNVCAARLPVLWRGTGISAMFLLLATLSARGERGGGVVEDSCRVIMGRGNRQAWIFQAERQLLGKDYPDTGVRRERNRVALAVLCKGEQQRTLMLTDEYGSLPSFPSSHFRPITVPVFVV